MNVMKSNVLVEIEKRLDDLSVPEQRWLIEELVRRVGQLKDHPGNAAELAAMAADPEVQRELRAIETEFAGAESDGLEKL